MKQYKANGHSMPVKSDGVTKLQSDGSPVHTDQIIRQKGTVTIPLMYGKGTKGVPLMYGECTGGVLKRYCKGTTNVLRRYWTYTKDLLSVGTPRVPRDRTDRQSVGHDRTRVRGGYHTASGSVGALFGCCSTVLRQLFGYESKRCRSGLEEQSKRTRRGLEQESNKMRSDVEEIGLSQGFWYRTTARLDADILSFFIFDLFVCFQRMMKNKAIRICVYGFVSMLFNNAALAQSHENGGAVDGVGNIRSLQIGDAVPEELWNLPLQVINHPDGKETITLNDYRDKKLIILDFWATWCAPCIKSLDKINEFFDQYQDDLLLVAVTREKHDKVAESMDRHGWTFLSAIEEDTLHQYFPHKIIPHHVWINNGKVLAITAPEYAKPTNIEAVLAGSTVQFYHKTERLTDMESYERTEPNTSFLYFSAFKPFTDQIAVRSSVVTGSIKCDNHSLKQLYTKAFSPLLSREIHDPVEWRVDQMLFDEIEGKRMFRDGSFENDQKYMEWADQFFYSYILEFDRGSKEQLYEIFQRDLNNFFGPLYGIRGEIKECSVPSFILTTSSHAKWSQKLEESKDVANGYRLVSQIKRMFPTHAVVVEDTLFYNQDFDLDLLSLSDQEKLMRSLEEQGVVCTMEQRKFNKLIIKSEDQ